MQHKFPDLSKEQQTYRHTRVMEILSSLKSMVAKLNLDHSSKGILLDQFEIVQNHLQDCWDFTGALQLKVKELESEIKIREVDIKSLAESSQKFDLLQRKYDELVKGTSKTILTPLMERFKQQNVSLNILNEMSKEPVINEYSLLVKKIKQSGSKEVQIYYGGQFHRAEFCGKLEKGRPHGPGLLHIADKIVSATFTEVETEDGPILETKSGQNEASDLIYYENGDVFSGKIRSSKWRFSKIQGTLKVLRPDGQFSSVASSWDQNDSQKAPRPPKLEGHAKTV